MLPASPRPHSLLKQWWTNWPTCWAKTPIELRLQNAVQEGDRMPNGVPHRVFGCREMEEAMINCDQNKTPLTGPNQGRGVAVGFRWQAGQASSATINMNADGTLNLITGSVDIGGTRTAVAMQVAETLGIEVDQIAPTVVDTDTVGWTATTGGSRIAFDTGLAAIAAARGSARSDGPAVRPGVGSAGRRRCVCRRRVHLQPQSRRPDVDRRGGWPHDANRRAPDRIRFCHVYRRWPRLCGQHRRRAS